MIKDAVVGFAVGDAFGVPVEFLDRKTIKKINLKDMVGCDTNLNFNSRWGDMIYAGSWSDDTSMLIATMDSMIKNEGEINYNDIMHNFLDWFYRGEFTSFGETFGVGGIIYDSLMRFQNGHDVLDCGGKKFMDNGNGSLMRILPISLYCINKNLDIDETCRIVSEASSITHAHDISKMSCVMFTEFLRRIIETNDKYNALNYIQNIDYENKFSDEALEAYKKILDKNFINVKEEDINESGYVVDTLESVLYSVMKCNNYEDTIIQAVNLGYDTDTVAGITGAIAGVMYGIENIPKRWLNKLKREEYLEDLSEEFSNVISNSKNK